MNEVIALERKLLVLGRQGENERTTIVFDISSWMEYATEGSYVSFDLINRRCGDTDEYPCATTINDGKLYWTIRTADVAKEGYGECELIMTVDERVAKSAIYKTSVLRGLGVLPEPPEPYQYWVNQVLEAKRETMEASDKAIVASGEAVSAAESASESSENASLSEKNAKTSEEDAFNAAESALNSLINVTEMKESIDTIHTDVTNSKNEAVDAMNRSAASETNASNSEKAAQEYAEAAARSAESIESATDEEIRTYLEIEGA